MATSEYTKIRLSYKGIGQMLRSDMMADVLMGYAHVIALKAGQDYEAVSAGTRVYVHPTNEKGEQDNLDNNTLLKSMR